MKFIHLSIVAILVLFTGALQAQEMVPAPGTTATPEESPTPTPASSEAASPSTSTETPSAQIETSPPKADPPARTTKVAKPSPTVKPMQSSGRDRSAPSQIKEMEERWAAAAKSRDGGVLRELLADDYVGLSSTGKISNKRQEIASITKSKDTYKSTSGSGLRVRMISKNVAVVTGNYREVGADKAGKKIDRRYRFIDTWVERNGKWQCVSSGLFLLRQ